MHLSTIRSPTLVTRFCCLPSFLFVPSPFVSSCLSFLSIEPVNTFSISYLSYRFFFSCLLFVFCGWLVGSPILFASFPLFFLSLFAVFVCFFSLWTAYNFFWFILQDALINICALLAHFNGGYQPACRLQECLYFFPVFCKIIMFLNLHRIQYHLTLQLVYCSAVNAQAFHTCIYTSYS